MISLGSTQNETNYGQEATSKIGFINLRSKEDKQNQIKISPLNSIENNVFSNSNVKNFYFDSYRSINDSDPNNKNFFNSNKLIELESNKLVKNSPEIIRIDELSFNKLNSLKLENKDKDLIIKNNSKQNNCLCSKDKMQYTILIKYILKKIKEIIKYNINLKKYGNYFNSKNKLSSEKNSNKFDDFHKNFINLSLKDYLLGLIYNIKPEFSTLIVMIIILERLNSNYYRIYNTNIQKLLLISLIIAKKLNEDVTYSDKDFSKLGLIEFSEVVELQMEFLIIMNYNIHVTSLSYYNYYYKIFGFLETS